MRKFCRNFSAQTKRNMINLKRSSFLQETLNWETKEHFIPVKTFCQTRCFEIFLIDFEKTSTWQTQNYFSAIFFTCLINNLALGVQIRNKGKGR